MAVRITEQDVAEIMPGKDLSNISVNTFILSANTVINTAFKNYSMDAAVLKEIERWYTAHLISSVYFKEVEEEKLGDADVKYAAKFGSNLDSTAYGQMVKQLDPSGLMINATKPKSKILAIFSDNGY